MSDYEIISATLVDGRLEIVKRYPSNEMYACNPPQPVPDRIEKEIYSAVDGQIVLAETIPGTHIPGYSVPETFEF
jgi:hypothetical protein